ncbi:hypothetical protein DL96DRAFT_1610126 [Flagelloscypha sp. PMI_526]|nr:hypothetical protein DL96DRAFT_1610126 [Flagelloscypha sp. PMI_526]
MDDSSSFNGSITSTTSLSSWSDGASTFSSSPQQGFSIPKWLERLHGKDLVQTTADLAGAFSEVMSEEGLARIGITGSVEAFRRFLTKFRISFHGSSVDIPTYADTILRTIICQAIERFADMIQEDWRRSLYLPRYIRGRLLDLFVIPGRSQPWIDYARAQPDGFLPSLLPEN